MSEELTEEELNELEKHAIVWDVSKEDARKLIAMARRTVAAEAKIQELEAQTAVMRRALEEWLDYDAWREGYEEGIRASHHGRLGSEQERIRNSSNSAHIKMVLPEVKDAL